MRVQHGLLIALFGLLALVLVAIAASPAQAVVTNQSRLDVGPSIEVRVNEAIPISPEVFEDASANVEVIEVWWDTDPTADNNPDGNSFNDKDVFTQAFVHNGLTTIGHTEFTLYVNYSDGKLVNATLEIDVVANEPPIITVGSNPSGTVGDPISFTVVVTDPDSPETSLTYAWDFDVQADADQDGQADNDIQSTAKSNVQFTYGTEGTYTAKITVTDDYGDKTSEFILVTVQKPPGISGRTVEVQEGYKSDDVAIQKGGWVTYHFVAQPGRTYEYDVQVTNGQDVRVMVQVGKEQFQQYENGVDTAYEAEYSEVNNPSTHITIQFKPDRTEDIFITVDNGYLFGTPGAREAATKVVVQDIDRNNIFAQIPSIVWVALVLIAVVVVSLYLIRFYFESSEARKARRAKEQQEQQEKASARGELAAILQNPDEVVRQKYAPKPAAPQPAPAPAPRPAPGPAPGPSPGPGPAPPPGGPTPSARPAPQAGPQPPPAAGPQPGPQPPPAAGPQPGPQPSAAATCGQCGSPVEAGWQICPSCGNQL